MSAEELQLSNISRNIEIQNSIMTELTDLIKTHNEIQKGILAELSLMNIDRKTKMNNIIGLKGE